VRTYALYLEERLECFRVLRYDIESERLRPAEGNPEVCVTGRVGGVPFLQLQGFSDSVSY